VPPTTVPTAVIETQPPSPIEQRFVDLINQERAGEGLAPMVVDVDITTIARNWSTELSHSGECSAVGLRHSPSYIDQMPPGWSGVAENVGCGRSVDMMHQGFMNSSGHRQNILNGTYNRVGVGVSTTTDGTLWVTQNFGRY
jgi:uncharacterized protein YkwD